MEELLTGACRREALCTIRHHATALRRTYSLTQVGFARRAELALTALGRVQKNDVVACLHICDTSSYRLNNAGTLVSEDRRKCSLWITSR